MKNNDLDLVIKDDYDMELLLFIVVTSMKTINNCKKSGLKILEDLGFYERGQIYRKVLFKFKLIRIRSKISCMAMEQGKTILELFLTQIMKSYYHFLISWQIPIMIPELFRQQACVFRNLIEQDVRGCL